MSLRLTKIMLILNYATYHCTSHKLMAIGMSIHIKLLMPIDTMSSPSAIAVHNCFLPTLIALVGYYDMIAPSSYYGRNAGLPWKIATWIVITYNFCCRIWHPLPIRSSSCGHPWSLALAPCSLRRHPCLFSSSKCAHLTLLPISCHLSQCMH